MIRPEYFPAALTSFVTVIGALLFIGLCLLFAKLLEQSDIGSDIDDSEGGK